MSQRKYVCPACRSVYPTTELIWRCSCGSYLNIEAAPGLSPQDIDREELSMWRYRAVLEAPDAHPRIYFGEGLTPLVSKPWAGANVNFKLDYLFPSGSFKDRGTAVMMNRLLELGVESVVEDSSGNGGASIAAYAAAGGIDCNVYVPEGTSDGKVVQTRTYGARVVQVPGNRQDTATAAQKAAADNGHFYASHNWHPLFVEGVKTVAYEIWEQLDFSAPDNVVAPAGFGSNVMGLHRGFLELRDAGQIDRLPRIFAAQAANCAAISDTWFGRSFKHSPTVAEGIASQGPVRMPEILRALEESGGRPVPVSEELIVGALADLGRNLGLFVEPTAAVSAAVARELIESAEIGPEEVTVAILTGNGLKATAGIAELGL